jgi:hypothetical protein
MSKNKKSGDVNNSWHVLFDVIKELGEGGNAKVFHVKQKLDGYELALKHLYNRSEEKKYRFIDEINIMMQNCKIIDGIIPIVDCSEKGFWYTMPIAKPVLEHIKTSGETIEGIIKGVIQLSETLSKLHYKGISHRDIKPSNIYFYNGRYCFGDFGLVEFPDNPNDFTRSDKGLGAIFTIAPEMKRDPKNADGKKADVFSLAKTAWMLLTGDDRGFDGVYDFLDKSHSLRFMDRFKDVHLVELEELLTTATNNDPNLRPNIDVFKQQLEVWLDVFADFEKSQISDWNFLNKYLFGNNPPESTAWRNSEKIVNVLNVIGTLPAYNHMLLSDGGGLDFSKAEPANEPGCIYIYDSLGFCFVVKPKCLYYEGFNEEYSWNYFLLELDTLSPIICSNTLNYEYLVEDYPAHYVSADYAQYGIYDYDSGDPLPDGYRVVSRYLKGKFLIVLKNGPYNHIPAAYDGRHGLCSNNEFREYINKLIETINNLKSRGVEEESILHSKLFAANPFSNLKDIEMAKFEEDHKNYKNPRNFVTDNYDKWCFKDLFEKYTDKENIMFYITFKMNSGSTLSFLSRDKLYICTDGYIKNLKRENLNEVHYIYNREKVLQLYKQCINLINDKCIENGFDLPRYENYFSIQLKRCGKPTHLFTKSEIEEAMRSADDRKGNMLVIDENGCAKVIQDTNNGFLYPVRHESWDAGNMYVGKYSKLSTLNDNYLSSLQGWLTYLETGKNVYMDYVHENSNVEGLIKEINKYY